MSEQKWGVVQRFEVEADTLGALEAAMQIVLTEYRHASGWYVEDGALHLVWHVSPKGEGLSKFVAPIEDPKELARVTTQWLKTSEVWEGLREPDTDGSTKRGFRVTQGAFIDMCKIEPMFIIYGK